MKVVRIEGAPLERAAFICPRCGADNAFGWRSDHDGEYGLCISCGHTEYRRGALLSRGGEIFRVADGESLIRQLRESGRELDEVSDVSERVGIPERELRKLVSHGYVDCVLFEERSLLIDAYLSYGKLRDASLGSLACDGQQGIML